MKLESRSELLPFGYLLRSRAHRKESEHGVQREECTRRDQRREETPLVSNRNEAFGKDVGTKERDLCYEGQADERQCGVTQGLRAEALFTIVTELVGIERLRSDKELLHR